MKDLSQPLSHFWKRLTTYTAANTPEIFRSETVDALQGGRPEPRDRNLTVRDRLLAAGAALLLEAGRENLSNVLSVQRLARRAGASRQSWHNQFPDHDYLEALAEWAADPAMSQGQLDFFRQAIDVYVEHQPPGVAVPGGPQLLEALSVLFREDDRYRVQLLLALMAPDEDSILAPLKDRNDYFNERAPEVYERMFRHAGFEPRPPHTCLSILVTLGALTDGYLVRSLIDPEHTAPSAHAQAAIAFLTGALVSVGSNEGDVDRRGPFDGLLLVAPADDVPITTDRVLQVLVELCEEKGSSSVALSDVAARLGCATAQLHSSYGSLPGFVFEVWAGRVLPDVRLAAESDAPPTDRLRAALVMLAARCAEHFWLTSLLLRCVHDGAERPETFSPSERNRQAASDTFAKLLGEASRATRAGERGGIGDISGAQVRRLAVRLEQQVLLEVVTSGPPSDTEPQDPAAVAERIVAEVWDVCVPGLRRPRPTTRDRARS